MRRKIYLFALVVVLLSVGCSPEVITLEKVHTEYKHTTDTLEVHDTTRVENNTIIREARPEDSLLLAQYGIRLRDNERMLLFLQDKLSQEKSNSREVVHDTIVKNDSIPVPYPVEKELTWWEKKKMEYSELVVLIMAGLLIFVIKLKK